MLARCLGLAFPESKVVGIAVGLASRHGEQQFSSNVELRPASLKFEQEERRPAPFPSCPNYDRKAWVALETAASIGPRRSRLMWNVL